MCKNRERSEKSVNTDGTFYTTVDALNRINGRKVKDKKVCFSLDGVRG
jgi:hypothetical protein